MWGSTRVRTSQESARWRPTPMENSCGKRFPQRKGQRIWSFFLHQKYTQTQVSFATERLCLILCCSPFSELSFGRRTRPKWRKGCSATSKICVLPQFWASNTSEVTKGSLGQVQEFAFYHSFERPTRPKWRKGRAAKWEICVLPQFWASDTSEVTKGSIRDVTNLRFTSVLSVRHVRSDERVAPICLKFAF